MSVYPRRAPSGRQMFALPLDADAMARSLSVRILAAASATETLRRWCEEHRLGHGDIMVDQLERGPASLVDDDILDQLRPEPREPIGFRRVRLARGSLALSEAANWYMPRRLSPDINHMLDGTNVPFGKIIEALEPSRRTFFVQYFVTGEGRPRIPDVIFEHRAVVLRRGGVPIAVVVERYLSTLVSVAPAEVECGAV